MDYVRTITLETTVTFCPVATKTVGPPVARAWANVTSLETSTVTAP
jgi:hypothetical protein